MTYEELLKATKQARDEWEVLNRKATVLKETAIDFGKTSSVGYKSLTSPTAQVNAHCEDEKALWREYYESQKIADEAFKKFQELAKELNSVRNR